VPACHRAEADERGTLLVLEDLSAWTEGEVALLDWEDVSAGPGILDLAWLLVSSTDPGRWTEATAAYGSDRGLTAVLPGAVIQALLRLADTAVDSPEARDWIDRVEAAARQLVAG
jgi:aminoglycoside phosphotransferase (APT) family kinase protein